MPQGIAPRRWSGRGHLNKAELTKADLGGTNLEGTIQANTSFDGVHLDDARWIDGRICVKGSIGQCN
ncbi:pentapeptide repeat-containing protein [Rhodococcus erythropolis]|uniref:pentapeptide repeat-containing protein n=1 Tax=Rhodococcus erythropolis TaxID=1833 RepID=UPI00294A6988|nr:pentapeptide repeat-containing protein [Rhodococcus erythropolis]MDV6278064.1 pentapeptide repeat-containing protein [Rhodococcus erythropolis]